MTVTVAEVRSAGAEAVFDVEDRHARERGVRGPHPRPVAPVRFVAVARITPAGRVELDPWLELDVARNPAGYDVFFGSTRPIQTNERRRLAAGRYAVRIFSGGVYQGVERADIAVPSPATPYAFDLEPGYAYPFPLGAASPRGAAPTLLRGGLHGPDAGVLLGARVEVQNVTPVYTVDEAGQWVLVFPAGQQTDAVTVRFQLPDGTTVNVAGVQVVEGRASTLAETGLRGSVLTDDGVSIAEAAVTVSGQPGRTLSRTDGQWSYYFRPDQLATNVNVTATLPDGRSQSRGGVPVQPRSTVVVDSFRFA
jgi:hypothetical protein